MFAISNHVFLEDVPFHTLLVSLSSYGSIVDQISFFELFWSASFSIMDSSLPSTIKPPTTRSLTQTSLDAAPSPNIKENTCHYPLLACKAPKHFGYPFTDGFCVKYRTFLIYLFLSCVSIVFLGY